MAKVCKRHADNPVMIYHQCVGCELEWFREELEQKQQEIERLEQERDKMIEGLRWYAKLNPVYTGHRAREILGWYAKLNPVYTGYRAREILKEIGVMDV